MKASILFLFLATSCLGQHTLQDAIVLARYLEPLNNDQTKYKFRAADEDKVIEVLMKYLEHPEHLGDSLFGNPFISSTQGKSLIYLADNIYSDADFTSFITRDPGTRPAVTSGMRVSNLTDGLARFLVKRTKQELTEAFFRSFQRRIKEDIYLATLFPETSQALSEIGEDIYLLDRYLDMLRSAFRTDADLIPSHLKQGLQEQAWLAKAPEYQIFAQDLLDVAQGLVDEQKPVELLEFLGTQAQVHQFQNSAIYSPKARLQLNNTSASLKLMHLVSTSLRAPEPTRDWFKPEEVQLALRDEKTRALYLGLLHLQSGGIVFGENKQIRTAFANLATDALKLTEFVQALGRFTTIGNRMKTVTDPGTPMERALAANTTDSYEKYYAFFTDVVDLVSSGLEVRRMLLPNAGQDSLEHQLTTTLENLTRLQLNIRQQRYVYAIVNVANVLDALIPQDQFSKKGRESFLRYGTFLASTCEARNGEEVANIIEYYAMPVGGSTLKKKNPFSISLNAYVGLTAGKQMFEQSSSYTYGAVNAPLGPAFNWSLGGRKGSLSAYFPLIDVGAVTAFRFENTTTPLPALEWRNILSPGAYLVYGFFNYLPISIGFGASRGPDLQKVNINGLEINDTGYKLNGFIGVDIPLVHFYTKRS